MESDSARGTRGRRRLYRGIAAPKRYHRRRIGSRWPEA